MPEIKPGEVMSFVSYKHKFADVFPGANTECFPINFELAGGGMGDYICWTPALQWISKNCPWVYGRIFAPAYFIEFVNHVFKDTPNWKVHLIERFKEFAEVGTLIRGLQTTPSQLLNATGCNLTELGFGFFANMNPMPPDTIYPQLDLDERPLHKALRHLDGDYVVFTPGGTTQARFVPARFLNPLIRFVKELGLTPVFLGKTQLADVHRSYFDEELLWSEGIDLREKTTILDAAKIMKHAACTLGLDNGLLHLAACTDASIIFGYNIAHPKERRPLRPKGKYIELTLTEEELKCIHCQTRYKLLYTHNFKNCIRKDVKCLEILFENEGKRWKDAILEIIK